MCMSASVLECCVQASSFSLMGGYKVSFILFLFFKSGKKSYSLFGKGIHLIILLVCTVFLCADQMGRK